MVSRCIVHLLTLGSVSIRVPCAFSTTCYQPDVLGLFNTRHQWDRIACRGAISDVELDAAAVAAAEASA
jgi:hypothetical protein